VRDVGSGLIATPTAEERKSPIAWPTADDDNVVRDVLETAPETVKARAYPTVEAAVEDLRG
jgi:hypothetical protein